MTLMHNRPDDPVWLRELVNHRHVVESMDYLSDRPRTVAELKQLIPATRRALVDTLRIMASHGLIVADTKGSWDGSPPATTVVRLTRRGMDAVESLSSSAVWTALYE